MAVQVVNFEDAVRIVQEQASALMQSRSLSRERVPLLDSFGRVLAQSVQADRDQPAFDRSTRDGFAVQASGWLPKAQLTVVGQVRAGELWRRPAIGGAQAVQIMTGAPVPDGADAVVMVEHVTHKNEFISPADERPLSSGENIVLQGSEAAAGQHVLVPGVRIGAGDIALTAACGFTSLEVLTRPTVAIVATGDELVDLDQEPQKEQIRNSNSYALSALVCAAGGTPNRLPIARDTLHDIRERIDEGRRADLLILSGGVSMGEYDLVEEVLTDAGADFFFTGVRMQPGKPVVFGRLGPSAAGHESHFFGLPGNPVSTEVTFHCFAELFVRLLGGESNVHPKWAQATLAAGMQAKATQTRLLPARMDGIVAEVIGWQGSGDLAANSRANCYAEFLPGRAYHAGEVIRVLLR